VQLLPGTCWRHLVVLRYRLELEDGNWSRPRAVCLLVDSLPDEASFRQLRVWLGWRARFRDDGVF
jgi:toxin CptA